ncbi:MAG: hypothetical protein C4311_06355 [Chloroflexota bacterium]
MALTLQQLIDQLQNILSVSDPDQTWPEGKLREWVLQGIREYSVRFPRRLSVSITPAVEGEGYARIYDLPLDFMDVLAVEWPEGADPPVWLERKPETEAGFGAGHYDIRLSRDSVAAARLVLGERPTNAIDKIRVYYLGLHNIALTPPDTLSVLEEDLELLIQFVKMRAFEERLANETLAADPTSDLVARLGHNARLAKEEFYRLVKQRERAVGGMVAWGGTER